MKKVMALILALIAAVCLVFSAFAEETPADGLKLLAINVRKADCLLLMSGQDVYMIDTGRPESIGQIRTVLASRGIDRLKGIIVTHTDIDHVGSLPFLLKSGITVENLYTSGYYVCSEEEHPVLKTAKAAGREVIFLKAGDVLPLEGGELRVLGPLWEDSTDENNNSLVMLAKTKDGTILLTGDMELDEEASLLSKGAIPNADVLKVAHHGAGDATSEALVRAVRPKAAIISTNSEDASKKPSKKVKTSLLKNGAQIAITQNATEGVLVTLKNGVPELELSNLKDIPEPTEDIKLADRDTAGKTVTVVNNGEKTVDLTGWYILFPKSYEIFSFPDGMTLAPAQRLTVDVSTTFNANELKWKKKDEWIPNAAMLYDSYGRIVSLMG